ncbi:MAG: hypothetical protein SGJ02_00315 [bacterium]|nr:hypothetical protein [bacterium]
MFILDWGARYIELFPEKEKYDDRFEKVDREILKKALQYHELRIKENNKERFTRTEIAIRDAFDHFLSYFERYNQFIEAGLLSAKELEPYLNYWIEAISSKIEPDVRNAIYHYINSYGFSGTKKLFLRFGQDIFLKTELSTTI